jgi:hypothetical protein
MKMKNSMKYGLHNNLEHAVILINRSNTAKHRLDTEKQIWSTLSVLKKDLFSIPFGQGNDLGWL